TFHQAMKVVSTLEGERDSITTVANHYFPPPSWGLGHGGGLATLEEETRKVLGFSRDSTAMLFTGADMDNLAVVKKGFQDMAVIALVTAGVKSNALRMGADSGSFYEPGTPSNKQKPGTINILLLTNMQLSTRAMTRAIISATEGKSAALQDLDIRSSYSSALNQATGTGTDNIIVVQGTGTPVDLSGGHTKMGELIARTVYEGVQQAIHKQNGLSGKRSIFQRLKERQINLHQYSHQDPAIYSQLERILLQEPYVSFMAASLAISDDYSHGLINDLNGFEAWCQDMADSIGGREVKIRYEEKSEIPTVINRAISSLVSGIRSAETSPLP
ncbi:MAG: adenosylcobinamide amidohydrolase, partial [Thermodesulfobacteriota bacterium]